MSYEKPSVDLIQFATKKEEEFYSMSGADSSSCGSLSGCCWGGDFDCGFLV